MLESFQPAKAAELRNELSLERKDRNNKAKKAALKKVLTNMTMSNSEMLSLFPEVNACMAIGDLEIKKMCFLYLETYAKTRPEIAVKALGTIVADTRDPSPLIRSLALRTLSSVPLAPFVRETIDVCQRMVSDNDPYVRKTAAFAVAKAWSGEPAETESKGLLKALNRMLADDNATVVSASLACLGDISRHSKHLELSVDERTAYRLAHILADCNEWSQAYILQNLTSFVPEQSGAAVDLIKLVLPRLQHANSAVVLGAIRLIVYLLNYTDDIERDVDDFVKKFQAPLVLLLTKAPEIQYVVLRNCILLLQAFPALMQLDIKLFYGKSQDPSYIKNSKIEILYLLADRSNAGSVLTELRTCATENDIEASKRAIRIMARLALKLETVAKACVDDIMSLVGSGVSHVVQEAASALQLVLRRYPNHFLDVFPVLLDYKETIFQDTEAKAAMVWMIGEYPKEVFGAADIMTTLADSFTTEPISVQLTMLTASLKLFIALPSHGKALVPRIFEIASETTEDPDLRDRAFMYWRLLSADPIKAREIVLSGVEPVASNDSMLDPTAIEELLPCIGFISSVYLRPPTQLFRLPKKANTIKSSAALGPRNKFKQRSEDTPTNRQTNSNSVPRPPKTRGNDQGLIRSQSILYSQPNQLRTKHSQAFLDTPTESPSVPNFPFGDESEKLIDI